MTRNKSILLNGIIHTDYGSLLSDSNAIAYEVLRIIDSKPLFFSDHIERLSNSLQRSNNNAYIEHSIKGPLIQFLRLSHITHGNIRIDAIWNRELHYRAYEIPHHYPNAEQYCNGVDAGTLISEREQPALKVWNHTLRELANKQIENQHVWEVLLINKQGFITEGSRSNVFFISGNSVISPPAHLILEGITRKHVIVAIGKLNQCTYFEKNIRKEDLRHYDAAFLTGTSPKVLPLKSIDEYKFSVVNLILSELIATFDAIIDDDLNNFTL